jgi:lactate dehydrogenase-like 2-hydroxyacid dehydrogenase
MRALKWKPSDIAPNSYDPQTRVLGILGLGGIGLKFAEYCHAFPMRRILYHNRHRVKDAPEWIEYCENVEDMLKQVDVLSVHVPLRKDTEGLVGEKWIRLMKRGSIIINTARGKVIDEEAMIRALEDGHVSASLLRFINSSQLEQLSSVGLDVFPNEPEINPRLLEFPQLALLPHMGTENQDTQRAMEVRALTNLHDYLTKGRGTDIIPELR